MSAELDEFMESMRSFLRTLDEMRERGESPDRLTRNFERVVRGTMERLTAIHDLEAPRRMMPVSLDNGCGCASCEERRRQFAGTGGEATYNAQDVGVTEELAGSFPAMVEYREPDMSSQAREMQVAEYQRAMMMRAVEPNAAGIVFDELAYQPPAPVEYMTTPYEAEEAGERDMEIVELNKCWRNVESYPGSDWKVQCGNDVDEKDEVGLCERCKTELQGL